MKFPTCYYCDDNAVWRRPWDNTNICLKHFNKAFLRRVQRTVNKYKLFDRDDVIAVGVSGGKDSVVLLDVLMKLQKDRSTQLIAVSIDEGIANYRDDGLKYAIMAAKRAGIEPWSWLLRRLSTCSSISLPSSPGMAPVNWLFLKFRT